MNEQILQIIENYYRELSSSPIVYPESLFREQAYACGTVADILNRIGDRPFVPAADTIWQYQMEIERYCRLAESSTALTLFCTMRDTIEQVILLLNTKGAY